MEIPKEEIWFQFSRSGGPGGQNVNKVASKVTLRWNLAESKSVSDFQRSVLENSALIRPYLTAEGIVSISNQESRSQLMNKDTAVARLNELVTRALRPKKARKKTKIPRNVKEKRITHKKTRSSRLKERRVPRD